MKKLYISILMIVISMSITSCCNCTHKDMKYVITYKTDQLRNYYTTDYVLHDGCVAFIQENAKDSTTFCGDFIIEKNPNYKPSTSNPKFRN